MRAPFLFLLLLLSTICFSQQNAEKIYGDGLKLEANKKPKEAFENFYKAAKAANEGSHLQLQAIFKSAVYYNYAEDKIKPEVTRIVLNGLPHLKKSSPNDTLAADYYFRAGLAFELDYQPDSALIVFSEALKRYEKLYGANCVEASDCYHCIGDVYRTSLYDHRSAEIYYEKALAVREKATDNELNRYLVSKLHVELALVNKAQGDYDKALAYGLKHIAYTETTHTKEFKERAYSVAAGIYADLEQYEEARNLYTKAIDINQRPNRFDKIPQLMSHYFGLAETFYKEGKASTAIQYYKKGISIFNSSEGPKGIDFIYAFQRLGELFLEVKEIEESRSAFRRGIALVNEYGLRKSGQASALYRGMGNYFRVIGKYDSSLIYFQQAIIASTNDFKSLSYTANPKLDSVELKDYAYKALLQKSNVLSLLYKQTRDVHYAKASLSSLSLAEKLLIRNRSELDTDDSKWKFFDANFTLYEQAIALLDGLQENQLDSLNEKIFYFMESSKAKMLSDALNEAEFSLPLTENDSLIQYLSTQKRNLTYLQDQFKKLRFSSTDKKKLDLIRNSIVDTDRRIEFAENEVNKKYPSYVDLKYNQKTPPLGVVKEYSRTERLTVMEFFWGAESVYGMTINNNQVLFRRIGSTDSLLSNIQWLHQFLNSDSYSYTPETIAQFGQKSHELYKVLIAPFQRIIEETPRLVILPDGPLSQIPFTILIKSTPTKVDHFRSFNYLIKTNAISYSFSSIFLLNQKQKELRQPSLLGFGSTGPGQTRSSSGLKDQGIIGSEKELKILAKRFPEGKFLFGDEVTEERFKILAPDYDIIHLAVHGQGNTNQNYSASLFFRDKEISSEDGQLHWYELFGIRLKAKLAVISSCESGIGKAYRGEGMLSMASAFAYAGCRNIVMGLWKVNDQASAEMMDEFYLKISNEEPVDIAMMKAVNNYIERSDELRANPKLWASLVVYGNQRVVVGGKNRYILIAGVSFLSVCFLMFFWVRYKKSQT